MLFSHVKLYRFQSVLPVTYYTFYLFYERIHLNNLLHLLIRKKYVEDVNHIFINKKLILY